MAMSSHKFKVGEFVTIVRPGPTMSIANGTYEVMRQLPGNGVEFGYRIKSASEPHERVVLESELTKA